MGSIANNHADLPEWKPSKFWKEQDFQSSARLHLQHWMWLYTLGYNIDPKIDLPKDKPIRVADVACCNGAWMLELHKQYPKATIDGFDLTSAHFPSPEWLPSNINFHAWDAFSTLPDECVGVFDVVHIRAIYSAVINNHVEPLIANVLKMLKPGGYLQWDEGDNTTMRAEIPPTTNANTITNEATSALLQFLNHASATSYGMDPKWLYSLPTTLKSKGCEILSEKLLPAPRELQRAWCDNMLTAWAGAISRMPEQPMPMPEGIKGLKGTMSRGDFCELLQKATEECAKGVFVNCETCTLVVRKRSWF